MIEGKNLWNAVDLVVRAGSEVSALGAELSKKMTERLSKDGGGLGFISETGDDDELNSANDWVCIASFLQWGLKPKGKGKKPFVGNLSTQIVIWTDDREQDTCGCIPRIEVAYMGSEESSPDEYAAGTWLSVDDWSDWSVSTGGKCLVSPKTKTPSKGAKWNEKTNWVFVIPLFSLNSNEDIDRLIIDPAMKLLCGEAPEAALNNVSAIEFTISKEGTLLSA